MKVFLSHSSKDAWATTGLIDLIRHINPDITVFCSSEAVIIPGDNYKETIFEQIKDSDVFLALISQNYWASKYSIIELGAAYAQHSYDQVYAVRIQPIVLPPLELKMAMADTPLVEIEVTDIIDSASMRLLMNLFIDETHNPTDLNIKIAEYVESIHRHVLETTSIFRSSDIDVFLDERPEYKIRKRNVVHQEHSEEEMELYYDLTGLEYVPSFLSLAILYQNDLNLREYLRFDRKAKLRFSVLSDNAEVEEIDLEVKSSDRTKVKRFTFDVGTGETELSLPLSELDFSWCEQVSEICFVLHPEQLQLTSGSVSIRSLHVEMNKQESLEI